MIDDYDFGRIVIDGKTYTSDVIVFPERIQESWWRKQGHSLCREDIKEILAEKPDILVVGTGAYGMMAVPPETARAVDEKGIKLLAGKTASACRLFNSAAGRGKVIGAFHLTC